MTGTVHLWAGALIFFGGHLLLSSGPVRPRLIEAAGERGFLALYSTIALIGLAWLGMAMPSRRASPGGAARIWRRSRSC
jgi:uncharacterized membrane protein